MPHFSLAKWSFVDLRELLGPEDAAPFAEVEQLQLVPRRALAFAQAPRIILIPWAYLSARADSFSKA